jgi:hypothetical protein
VATWQDRLREAAYRSPSGKRIRFLYEDVGREYSLRGTVFEFPGVDEAYVQRTGNGPRRYPLRCCFSGPQCDLEATAFESALLEPGTGMLSHPVYGDVQVVPYGDVGRRDDLKTAANQSVIECTFWTTVGAIYPTNDAHPQNEVLAAIGNFNVAAAQQFASKTSLVSAANKAATKSTIKGLLKKVGGAFDSVSSSVAEVRSGVKEVTDTINLGMDVLIGKPLLLAQQISNLIQSPARALIGLESRLDGYGRLFDSIFESDAAHPGERIDFTSSLLSRRQRVANDFHSSDLFGLNSVAGAVVAVSAQPLDEDGRIVRGPIFTTKPQAIAAAAAIADLLDDVVEWRDGAFEDLGTLPAVGNDQIDTGEAYQALKQAVALAQGMLIQTSFALVPERSITLDRARTIIDVAAEVYGAVDSRLDFLISSNNLSGSEILELPAGRKILYYAAA